MKLAPPTPCSRSAGSALTIVLITVSMVVLLVVLALSIASIDRRVASNTLAQESARSLADAALDVVANQIAGIPLDRHWAAAPGRLRIWNGSGWDQVDLHSGDGSGNTNPDESVDLNARLSDGTYPILPPNQEFPTAPEMRVRWIYVSEDGSTSTTPPASGVIGRYAYWADIENGRVNINTAGLGMTEFDMPDLQSWALNLTTSLPTLNESQLLTQYRNNVWAKNPWVSDRVGIDANTGRPTFPPLSLNEARQNTPQYLTAHPSSINLSYLDGVSAEQGFNTFRYAGSYFLRADALTSMLQVGEAFTGTAPIYWDPGLADDVDLSVRFFDAPEDWQRIVDADTFEANKGYLTVRGRTPEITPWGTPKLAISLATREHANQRNDLTETDHRRNSRLLTVFPPPYQGDGTILPYQFLQDTRVVQLPALNPGVNTPFSTAEPGRFHRLAIRDLSQQISGNQNRHLPNRLSAVWGIKQHLAGPLPGLPGTLAAKYDASSAGEADQVTVELATFMDNQLGSYYPGHTRNLILHYNTGFDISPWSPTWETYGLQTYAHYSGRRLPYVPTASTTPIVRRLGAHGGPLLNEVRARAFSVPATGAGTNLGITSGTTNRRVDTLGKLGDGTLSVASPTGRLSLINSTSWQAAMHVFLLRDPAWTVPPPNGTTNDRFIRVEFDTEVFLPELWSLREGSLDYRSTPNGTTLNSDFTVWVTDVVCEVNGVVLRSNLSSPHDMKDKPNPNQITTRQANAAQVGSFSGSIPGNGVVQADRAINPANGLTPGILIGPFNPTEVVNFKLKIRIVLNAMGRNDSRGTAQIHNDGNRYASTVPGIFPDPAGQPNATSGVEVDSFLEFDFPAFNMDGSSGETTIGTAVSLEARDPRVIRRNSDWIATSSDSIGLPNLVFTPPATADLYRPDPLLQHVRGMLRSRIASDDNDHTIYRRHLETQSATRILGLPGVGYLSSIPTGVNSGIPWQTMKFLDSNEPVPDWILWSLFYVPFDRSIHNQTDGKLNINATLWPWGIERARPLEALLGDRVSNPESLSRSIASAAGAGKSIGPSDMFVYPGQICQVPGVTGAAAEETDREALARDLADIITTQCDDFRVFVIAQPLRQAPNGTFTPLATARLEATISRSPDEGGGDFFFGPQDDSSAAAFPVFTRASYQSGGTRGTKINALQGTPSEPSPSHPDNGFSHLGSDGLPNTSDDWLIPQKIQISRLRYLP